jgi:phage nucleotide-binding protein
MAVQIIRTSEMTKPSLVLTIYGQGGTGKTTLAATSPSPIFLDAEEGTKALGARGIDVPVVNVKHWKDVQEAWGLISASTDYQTVVIDPMDAFLNLLVEDLKGGGDMTLQKWGFAKDRLRKFIWAVKKSGKHVVFVAHEDEKEDEGKLVRRPKLAANMSGELVDLCDVVGHLRVGEGGKRELLVQPTEKWVAKDRFAALGDKVAAPNVSEMVALIHAAYDKPPFVS